MALTIDTDLKLPSEETARSARHAADELQRHVGLSHPSSTSLELVADDGPVRLELPGDVVRLLIDILRQVADGHAVTVAPVRAEITTQQAADLLNVSRPYLVELLENGQIPFRRVGNRRRVQLVDVLDYRNRDLAESRIVADQLTAEAQRLGIEY